MKKLLSLVLAAALLLTLAACGTPTPIPNPPLVLGEKYLSDLDYEQALLQFDQAIAIEPKNPRGYLGKADALLHLDRQSDAASALATGAKAASGDTRTALKAAQVEVEKSPVDGYIGLSSAYEKLGWREIALLLLKRVCEELPEEGRLREALEQLEKATKETTTNPAMQKQEGIPVNVFKIIKDIEAFGVIKDGTMDIYALAEKCGYSRSDLDAAKSSNTWGNAYPLGVMENDYRLTLETNLDESRETYSADFAYNFPEIVLPADMKIGMTLDEVLYRFCCPQEKRDEVAQAFAATIPYEAWENDSGAVRLYTYDNTDYRISAICWPKVYSEDGMNLFDAIIFCSIEGFTNPNYDFNYCEYGVEFNRNDNTVRKVFLNIGQIN